MEPQLNLIRSFPLKIFLIDLKAEEATNALQGGEAGEAAPIHKYDEW